MAAHLTKDEREIISQMHFAGATPATIGRALGRDRSVISRELKRNSRDGTYSANCAQRLTEARRRERPLVRKMDRATIHEYVCEHLVRRWSPDQIVGRLRREFPRDRSQRVSAQTIYRWIAAQSSDDRRHWERFLRWKGRKKPPNDRRGHIPAQVHIDRRPKIVDRRARYGDWEGDTIVGRRHRGGLVTLVERKSGYLLTAKLADRHADRVSRALVRLYQDLPPTLRRTLTLDNGKEFAHHEWVSKQVDLDVYFAKPYAAWQRGSNEHVNLLLREYFPKGTDFQQISRNEVADATNRLNNRPRKRLNYLTPNEVFNKRLVVAFQM